MEQNTKENLITGGAALTAGLGAYGLARSGLLSKTTKLQDQIRRTGLVRAIEGKAPKGLQKVFHRISRGVDDVVYSDSAKNARKIKGKTVVPEHETKHWLYDKKNKVLGTRTIWKHDELDLIRRMEGKGTTKFTVLNNKWKGPQGLSKLNKTFGEDNYYVKPTYGWDSGVGGENFINRKNVTDYLAGKTVNRKKVKLIEDLMKHPKKYIAQKDMKIEEDILGKNKEFRIHAIGNKVIPGASTPRGGNVTSFLTNEIDHAERYVQKALKKIPKKYHNAMFGIDVAKTKSGKYKIIELNGGSLESGFMSPEHMYSHGGVFPMLDSVKRNQSMYKYLTGRSSSLESGLKGVAAGTTTGAGVYGLQKLKKKDH